jgi:drug/metabolite transporter (DMT)-like permease
VLGGDSGFSLADISSNIVSSPVSYLLAFSGAIIWAAYCTVTSKYADGNNGITFFILLTAVSLWVKFLFSDQPPMHFTLPTLVQLVMVSIALGFGYAAWNTGILHGHVPVLAAASYFTPVLSSALAALVLSAPLSWGFWQGAVMVCGGSLLCWYATRKA